MQDNKQQLVAEVYDFLNSYLEEQEQKGWLVSSLQDPEFVCPLNPTRKDVTREYAALVRSAKKAKRGAQRCREAMDAGRLNVLELRKAKWRLDSVMHRFDKKQRRTKRTKRAIPQPPRPEWTEADEQECIRLAQGAPTEPVVVPNSLSDADRRTMMMMCEETMLNRTLSITDSLSRCAITSSP